MTYTQRPIGRASLLLAVLVLALTACGAPATIGQPGTGPGGVTAAAEQTLTTTTAPQPGMTSPVHVPASAAAGASATTTPDRMEGTPGPAGAAAACAAVQADITDIVRTDVTQTEAPLDDPVTGVTRHGCQLAATWTGAKQDDVVGMSQHVSARLTEQGWTEDQRYTADGPTGTVLGFRKDRLLALLSVDWQPGPAVQCPADQPITECQMLPEQRRYALTLQIGEATGGSADATSVATAVPAAGQETATPISSASPEEVIAAYWQAFAKHEATVAYDLLTPAAQARTTAAELASASAAVQTVTVVRTEPLADGADRSIYLVDLQVTPVPGAVSPWNAGSNPRWMELHSEATGWRIHEISSSPLAGEAGSTPRTWQRVDLAQAPGLSFAVPQGWEQLGVETT